MTACTCQSCSTSYIQLKVQHVNSLQGRCRYDHVRCLFSDLQRGSESEHAALITITSEETYHISRGHWEEARSVWPRAHIDNTEIGDTSDLEVTVENGVWIYGRGVCLSEVISAQRMYSLPLSAPILFVQQPW